MQSIDQIISIEKRNKLTAREREQNQAVDEKELDDIDHHSTQRNLQRSQVRIDGKQMDQFKGTVNVTELVYR